MKKKLHFIFSVVTLILSSTTIITAQRLKGVTIEHGLYDVNIAYKEKAPNTLTQSTNIVDSVNLLFRTDTVLADIGKTFGMKFSVNSNDGGTYAVTLRAVWEFPKPMVNPFNHKTYKESWHEQYYITNQPTFHSYTLEYDYELVEGWWTFKLMQGETVVYQKQFWVFRPL